MAAPRTHALAAALPHARVLALDLSPALLAVAAFCLYHAADPPP